MPSKPNKRSNLPNQKKPSLAVWQELDRKSRGKTYEGDMVQFYALESLRLESLSLADLNHQEQQLHQHDLTSVQEGYHYRLIGCGPRLKGMMVFSGLPLHGQRGLAVFPLALGQRNLDPNRVAISIDPSQPWKEVLMDRVERIVLEARERIFHRKRARGGGRPHPLAKMWEALQLYAERKQTKTPLKLLKLFVHAKRSVHQANKLLALANRMIKAAQAGPTAWRKAFPLR